MRVLAIVHQPDAGPGVFADAVAGAGARLELWRPAEREPPPANPADYGAIMSFGGGMNPDQIEAHPWLSEEKRLLARCVSQEVPLLGVCLGAELLADATGGSARRARSPEIGWYPVRRSAQAGGDPLLGPLPPRFEALEWHSYAAELPPGGVELARSETCLQAFRVGRWAWGVQFHAEVTLQSFEAWLDRYAEDPDAEEVGIDPGRLGDQTRRAMAQWNQIGRALCTRFLELAERKAGVQAVKPG
jgi:GMP synthase (glutamine-hydrolysing)